MTLPTPGPGWAIVRPSDTHESYAGSRLVIPDPVRDRVARNQFDVLAVSTNGAICHDPDCDRPHDPTHCHPVPPLLTPGAWVLAQPRALVAIPGHHLTYLIPQDAIWASLEGVTA